MSYIFHIEEDSVMGEVSLSHHEIPENRQFSSGTGLHP